jgi:serine/threonine protein kinase
MERFRANADILFARALEIPPGAEREEFLRRQCAGDLELRAELESLLHSHEHAGDFLLNSDAAAGIRVPAAQPFVPGDGGSPAQSAGAFLRAVQSEPAGQVEEFLQTLPEAARQETAERIQAALRLRSGKGQPAATPEAVSEAAPTLAGFRLGRKLGEGKLGVVYAAHDEKLDRPVALKVLRRRGLEFNRRILEEARKAAALSDPAVVTIFSVLDETDPPAIVMELVEGFPLDRFARQLTVEQKARLLREVVRGLAAAHERGLIHRDLKPDNILVGPDLRPRILDFGLALTIEESSRHTRAFEGTPLYASPEQVMGVALTSASDIFSFGSLMFKVLTDRPPFSGANAGQVLEAIATTSPPFLCEVALGIPQDLQAVCLACLAWNPADRPTAAEIAVELGRFLLGEPVRMKPKLYDDLLRQGISDHSSQTRAWQSQNIISIEERDALETIHRRLLAGEDHWIIDARRITPLQTILSAGAWLAVVATILTVWMLHHELAPPWRWVAPLFFTSVLLTTGFTAHRARENLAAANFLAGAALALAPCMLSLMAELGWLARPAPHVSQLFAGSFTNQQVAVSTATAFVLSVLGLWRLRMTGFAWTSAALATATYVSFLLLFDWLNQPLEVKARWCLPLVTLETVALTLERKSLVRWTLPFHLVAFAALVGCLDLIALNGPTLGLMGIDAARFPYFDHDRQQAFSLALNGLLFLLVMLATEKANSLDLRRASKLFEILALLHILSPLFLNAMGHRSDARVRTDVWVYLSATLLFVLLASLRSKWRMLVGGLAGCGLGSYLLVDLGLVAKKPFIIGLGFFGLLLALGALGYVRSRASQRDSKAPALQVR